MPLATIYIRIIEIRTDTDYTHIRYSNAFGDNPTVWEGHYRKPQNESIAATLKPNHCYQINQTRIIENNRPRYQWDTATEIRTKKKAEPVSDSARLSSTTVVMPVVFSNENPQRKVDKSPRTVYNTLIPTAIQAANR